ncbi:FAD-dependent oxidoreductase [Phytoactinopolyspora halotolerans]|uniref:FAD-dependent oxidoreductase n=1 Tax=Phytoactinopolyspora halotolerans TaxID=1981512 RepID=A0A6L9S5Y6_9ACTN|nr:FAD-dependent oxidoreductase [Phytoactinopolyspora halotolerans]NEE00499.1 FAD-dependent oxidoreductase [Phytoactinopolyspora halotolerans]
MARLVVVGGGVLGSMHAWMAVEAGHDVVHLEREAGARGASVRNFGLVWVSGRARGAELELAVRARELWERVAGRIPAIGFRANGSITVITRDDELAVISEVCARADAVDRGLRLLDGDEVTAMNPALRGLALAGLYASRDAAVEPRLVPAAVRDSLAGTGRYRFLPGREVVDVQDSGGVRVTDATGDVWDADRAVLCTGAWHAGVAGRWLADAPLRRVRLHMMQTAPLGETLTTSVADADSLRYYPAYEGPALRRLAPPDPAGAAWGMQLLMVQRLDGGLTIGDTHLYTEPFGFDLEEEPYRLLTRRVEHLLGRPLPAVQRRWTGVYSQLAPAAAGTADHDRLGNTAGMGESTAGTDRGLGIYLHREVLPGVHLVTGPGGRGMTLAPVIAERTLVAAGLLDSAPTS